MEITKVKSSEIGLGYGPAYLINEASVDHLVGRALTLLEALGLRETQEKATKDLLRQEIWKAFTPPHQCTYIDSDLHSALVRVSDNLSEHYKKTTQPPGAVKLEYEVVVHQK